MRVDKYTIRRIVVLAPFIALVACAGWWGLSQAIQPSSYTCAVRSVDVESGDTLYNIARRHCVGDVDTVTGMLVKMYGTDIDTWQTIHLPIDQ